MISPLSLRNDAAMFLYGGLAAFFFGDRLTKEQWAELTYEWREAILDCAAAQRRMEKLLWHLQDKDYSKVEEFPSSEADNVPGSIKVVQLGTTGAGITWAHQIITWCESALENLEKCDPSDDKKAKELLKRIADEWYTMPHGR